MKKEVKEFFEYISGLEDLGEEEYEKLFNEKFDGLSDEAKEEVKEVILEIKEDEEEDLEDDELDYELKQYKVIEKKLDCVLAERLCGRELDRQDILDEEFEAPDYCYESVDFCEAEEQAYQIVNCLKIMMDGGIGYTDALTMSQSILTQQYNIKLQGSANVAISNAQI